MIHLCLTLEDSSISSGEAVVKLFFAAGTLDAPFCLASEPSKVFRHALMDAGSHADIERRRASIWKNESIRRIHGPSTEWGLESVWLLLQATYTNASNLPARFICQPAS